MNIINIYYTILLFHTVYGLIIYNYVLKQLSIIEKITKITIQINIANTCYYIYKILVLNNYIQFDISSHVISILYNLNGIVSIGYIVYRYLIEPVHNFYIYYDSVQLHLFNLLYMTCELYMNAYIPVYIESTAILTLVLFIAWGPLYYYHSKWNYNICLYKILGVYCIFSIYLVHYMIIYTVDIIKN